MTKGFMVELTTLCMIENEKGEVLIQDRQKPDWPGWTFPGGHVEKDEGMTQAVIREIQEECGLNIQPVLMGIAEWRNETNGARELAGLYYGKVTARAKLTSDRGEAQFWVPKQALTPEKLAGTMGQLLPIFLGKSPQRTFYRDNA